MNEHSDIGRVLRHWFEDGPDSMPDRVVDVVATRISLQHQRRAWPFPRRTNVNVIKIAAAMAAVLVVAILGYSLLPGQPGFGGPAQSQAPTPRPTQSPVSTPDSFGCEDDLPGCSGVLIGGPHVSTKLVPQLRFETTGGFWANVIDLPGLYKIDKLADPSPGYPYILVWTDASITDQDTACSGSADPVRGRAAGDWVDLVTTHVGLVASSPVEVDFGSVTAQQLELAVAPTWTLTCPNHEGPYVTLLTQDVAGNATEYGLPAAERMLLTVADVADRTVVIMSYGFADAADFAAQMGPIRAIIASFRF